MREGTYIALVSDMKRGNVKDDYYVKLHTLCHFFGLAIE